MNCPRCGTSNLDNLSNCVRCGAALVSAGEAETFIGASLPPTPAAKAGAAPASAPQVPPRQADGSNVATAGPRTALGIASSADHVDFGPRYRIDRLLGQGGMGAVYKAWDKELERPVALKLIRPDLAVDPAVEQRFKQELLLASKISHTNLLRIHDLGEAAGVKFISMAFVEGKDLHQFLTEHGKLTVERALKIAKQLCSALEAAHSEGVAHRDFKPQNILLDKQENVYVSDFGLAKSLEHDTGMTKTGEFLGTPRYMAPEQVQGGKIDHRADLYALGLILYEMVTGDVPFHAGTTLQLMYKRVHEVPKSPKALNPDLPDWLVRVIMKCLERDPDQRYQNAGEILKDLETGTAPVGSKTLQIAIPSMGIALSRTSLGIAGAVVILGAMLLAVPSVRHRVFGSPASTAEQAVPAKHVAVLPLKVIGDEKALGYIGGGVVDALTAKLFQLKDVQIAAPAAVAKLKPDTALGEAANTLGANYIVTGNLQGEGDKIRLVLNLDDVAGGKRLWTQEFSGLKQDLLTLEDNAYAKLVAALSVKASSEEIARAAAHPTENVDAYDLYLKGRNAMHGEVDANAVKAAIKLYEQALQRDPAFALAYTGIADASLRMYINTKDASWAQKALGAAQQAQNTGESLPEVHFALGSIYTATGKPAEATAELTRALQLAPNSDEGYRRLGDAYRAAGKKEDAIKAYQRATEINPYYWLNYNTLGLAYVRYGNNDEALASLKKVTQLAPKNGLGYVNMGNAYYRQGKWDEAIAAFKKSIEVEPNFHAYTNLATTYFFLKRYQEAVPMFEKAVELQPQQQLAWGNLADACRWSGQKQKAVETYGKAIALASKELEVNPRDANLMAQLGQYYAKSGKTAQGLQYVKRARAISPNEVPFMYFEGMVQGLAGNTSEAIAALRSAFEKGYPVREAINDPELDGMRSNPEFQNMIKEFEAKK
ncbi:MAG TPA: tetratricopeptide repeat protein [Terriglobales bacterium]